MKKIELIVPITILILALSIIIYWNYSINEIHVTSIQQQIHTDKLRADNTLLQEGTEILFKENKDLWFDNTTKELTIKRLCGSFKSNVSLWQNGSYLVRYIIRCQDNAGNLIGGFILDTIERPSKYKFTCYYRNGDKYSTWSDSIDWKNSKYVTSQNEWAIKNNFLWEIINCTIINDWTPRIEYSLKNSVFTEIDYKYKEIDSLKENLTEMQNWIRENSESKFCYDLNWTFVNVNFEKLQRLNEIFNDIVESNPDKLCKTVLFGNVSKAIISCEKECFPPYVFKGTNISTERFFR